MADTVTVNTDIKTRTFVKYRVVIERVDVEPTVSKSWVPINSQSGEYGYTPEYASIEYDTTEVLKMEVREEIDLRRVVKALLWKDGEQ